MTGTPPVPQVTWSRLHPVTPLVKGWAALLVGLAVVADGVVGGPLPGPDTGVLGSLGLQFGGVLVIAVLVVLGNVLGWYFARYSIDSEAVRLHTGVLNRTQRQARLDRLQAVDVVQPLIGRLVGLAELRIEVAGGSDSQVRLQYLKESEAERLRNSLLAAAAGVEVEEGQEAPEAPENAVLSVPPGRLVGGTALSGPALILLVALTAVLVAAVVALALPGVPIEAVLGGVAAAVPGAFLVLGVTVFSQFAKSFNFRLAVSPDGIRVRAGLTETRSATIPPGRVQAISISQSWLWRRFDWWHVKVNIAGYAQSAEQTSTSATLLPVGSRRDAFAVLALVSPGTTREEIGAVEAGMVGRGPAHGYSGMPRSARWLDLFAWRRIGYAVTDRAVLARTGLLNRQLVVVPHERVQSLGLQQGPLQRALGVVTFRLHSTPGPVDAVVPHLSLAEGSRLLSEQSERSRLARAAAGPERWMRRARAEQQADAPYDHAAEDPGPVDPAPVDPSSGAPADEPREPQPPRSPLGGPA